MCVTIILFVCISGIDVSERKIVHCVVRRIESDDGSAQRRSLLFSNTSGATLSTPSKSLSFCFFDSSNTNVLALSPRTLCRGLYQSDTPFDKTFELKVLQLMNARYGPDGNYFGGEFELIEDIGIRKDILDHQTRKVSQYIHEIHGIKDLQCTRAALLSHTATDQEYSRWLYTNERGELTSLHTDSSEITVNACISSSNFQGSDICFQTFANSDQSSAESQREFLDTSNVLNSSNIVHVRQRPGQALWHRGDMPHSVAPLVAGTRFNLLMWFSH